MKVNANNCIPSIPWCEYSRANARLLKVDFTAVRIAEAVGEALVNLGKMLANLVIAIPNFLIFSINTVGNCCRSNSDLKVAEKVAGDEKVFYVNFDVEPSDKPTTPQAKMAILDQSKAEMFPDFS